MTGKVPQRREGAGASCDPFRVTALVLLASAAASASADNLSARSVVGYQGTDLDARESRALHQSHDLGFDQTFSETIKYRLAFRYEDDRGSNVVPGEPTDSSSSRTLRPLANVNYQLRPVTLQTGYDLIYSDSRAGSAISSRRSLERLHGTLDLRLDRWPTLRLQGERRTTADLRNFTDNVQTDLSQTLAHDVAGISLQQGTRFQRFDDRAFGFQRNLFEATGRLGYAKAVPLLAGVNVSASNQLTVTRSEERSLSSVPIKVPNPVTGASGIYAYDRTPETSQDAPMSLVPALTDGNVVASAGISLGQDGTPFQNVGVDMGRFVAVDALRIFVRTAAGNLVPNGGTVQFDVFTSADGVSWFPAARLLTRFDIPGSFYEIQFVEVTARFFKAMSFGANSTETLVTEIQPLLTTTLNPQERRGTTNWLDVTMLSFNVQPRSDVTVQYAGLLNVTGSRTLEGRGMGTHYDADQTGSISWQAAEPVRLEARYQRRELSRTGQSVDRTNIVSVGVDLAPRPELRHNVTATRTDDTTIGRVSHTNAISISNAILFYRSLDLALTVSFSRQLWPAEYQRIDRWYLSAASNARLTSELNAVLTAAVQQSDAAAPLLTTAGLTAPISRDEQYAAELIYHPSPQLNLAARFGYTVTARTSGWVQRYRVYWDPLPGGAIQIGGSVDQEVDAMSDSRFSRVNGFFRWTVNAHAALDAIYSQARIRNHVDSRNDSFSIFLTLKL